MTQNTKRDLVWAAALRTAFIKDIRLTPSTILEEPDVDASERTVRDVLRSMENLGILRSNRKRSGDVWYTPTRAFASGLEAFESSE